MPVVANSSDWEQLTLTQLVDHIEQTHHVWMRAQMPRILAAIRELAHIKDPVIRQLRELFTRFTRDLDAHMVMEEREVFPACRRLDAGIAGDSSVRTPLHHMIEEHDDGGALLLQMRELTDDFTAPPNADPRLHALYQLLRELAQNLREHVYKENCLVAFKAEQAEQLLSSRKAGKSAASLR